MVAKSDDSSNPFRKYVLPMAYEHIGLLHAVLGLATCHMDAFAGDKPLHHAEALEHRLHAIQSLSSLIMDDRNGSLQEAEENFLLATILILVLHDVSENARKVHNYVPRALFALRYCILYFSSWRLRHCSYEELCDRGSSKTCAAFPHELRLLI